MSADCATPCDFDGPRPTEIIGSALTAKISISVGLPDHGPGMQFEMNYAAETIRAVAIAIKDGMQQWIAEMDKQKQIVDVEIEE